MTTKGVAQYGHLGPKAIAAMELSNEKRISYNWSTRWIGYEKARQLIEHMEFLLSFPREHRMPCLLIVGESNSGKSTIINRFKELHQPSDNPDGRTIIAPVVVAEAPTTPDEGRLYNNILDAIFAPHKANDHPDNKRKILIDAFEAIGVKMLLLDELNNLLAGRIAKRQEVLNALRIMTNDLKMPIVAAGIESSQNVFDSDPQLKNRFKIVELGRWSIGEDLARLLKSFEMQLALKKPSMLATDVIATRVLAHGKGLIGDIASTLKHAAEVAVRSGTEMITPEILDNLPALPSGKA